MNANVVTETKETGKESRNNLRFSLSETYSLSRLRQWEAAKKQAKRPAGDMMRQNKRCICKLSMLGCWHRRAPDGLRLIEARIKNLTEQLKRAEALAEAGRGTRIGFLQSRVGLANVQAQLVRAKNNFGRL